MSAGSRTAGEGDGLLPPPQAPLRDGDAVDVEVDLAQLVRCSTTSARVRARCFPFTSV